MIRIRRRRRLTPLQTNIWRNWRLVRRLVGTPGYGVELRRAAYADLQALYATQAGQGIGLAERLALASVVWPTGQDE